MGANLTRYIVLFSFAGIIEMIFMGLGMGMSMFSILSAMTIILFSFIILGKRFVNGRIVRLAIAFSVMHLALGNIPIALASRDERIKPVTLELGKRIPEIAGMFFKGPLDHLMYFWIIQSFVFTLVFLGVFILFSFLLRRIDHGLSSGAVQNQDS
jgi:hypothetical protein